MGVIKRPLYRHSSVEEQNVISLLENQQETILEEPAQHITHLPSLLPPGGRRTPQGFRQPDHSRGRNRPTLQRRWSFGTGDDGRPQGLKKRRRLENHKYLLSLAPEDGEPLPTIPEHGESGFAPLFRDTTSMKAWNAFLAFPEEQQFLILESGILYEEDDIDVLAEDFCRNLDISFNSSEGEPKGKSKRDGRWIHPGYNAKEAYEKLCPKVKSVLKRKHFPLGNLIQMEEEVTSFFEATPHGVYIKELDDGFMRLVLHGTSGSSSRPTLIRNFYPCFAPPELTLAQYVEKRFGAKRQTKEGNQ